MKQILVIITVLIFAMPCDAKGFFQKKDYKESFIQNAIAADRRNNTESAFHLFEKAMYYYGNDKKVVEAYAAFCERRKYYQKAKELYNKLYVLTKNPNYLFKEKLSAIKDGKLDKDAIKQITNNKSFNEKQQKQIKTALVMHYSYKEDWGNTKKFCNSLGSKNISHEIISSCIIAAEKTSDKKSEYSFFKRYSQLSPKDISILKKVIVLSQELKDAEAEELYVKKFSELLPDDRGIKYQLAGVYEKHGKYLEANKIYEELINSGDTSDHVKKSYAYSLEQSSGVKKQVQVYKPAPFTKKQIQEMAMYHALEIKDFLTAEKLLNEILKRDPKNTKFTDLRADVAIALKKYPDAIKYFEKLAQLGVPLNFEDKKLLAFSYSKINNYAKTKEIIDELLKNDPENKDLIEIEFEYAMQFQDWDNALFYNEKLLSFNPNAEESLKARGDLYSIKKDFANSIVWYEKLSSLYPKAEYNLVLANLYMANQQFEKAEKLYEKFHETNPDNKQIALAYLNSLMAGEKLQKAYWLIKRNQLEKTKEGCIVLGDMAMLDKDWGLAQVYYQRALFQEKSNPIIKNKLAQSLRAQDKIQLSQRLFKEVLAEYPDNLEAKIGLGYIEIDKKEYQKSREIFYDILAKNPDYKGAKVGLVHTYSSNNETISTVEMLDKLNLTDRESEQLKAQSYYDMQMYSDAKTVLRGYADKEAKDLRYKIKKDTAITLTPSYTFFNQQLAEQFKLDAFKIGLNGTGYVGNNTFIFGEYNMNIYQSGNLYGVQASNIANEVRGGFYGRPKEKVEYRADVGCKFFQGGGAMVNTDSWFKYIFNDKFNLKLGFKRNNLEQSYVSAVGYPIDGLFTGRVAENKVYLEYEYKFPKSYYSFGRAAYGIMAAQNLPTNQYLEGMVGVGKVMYNNPENKWIQIVTADLVTYNTAYQFDLLNLYNSAGQLFGGYFSPSFYTANTLNIKVEGENKKLRIKYGIKGFVGAQVSFTPNFITPTGGVSPYLSINPNDHISINLSYTYLNYAEVQRDLLLISVNFRGFKKNGKN